MYVVLLTDGEESCTTLTSSYLAATELRTTIFGGRPYDVRTFVADYLPADQYIQISVVPR